MQFGVDLYKGNDCYCPPLVFDEINTFKKGKNPAHEVCDYILFMAYRNGEIVGRIAGMVNHRANEA